MASSQKWKFCVHYTLIGLYQLGIKIQHFMYMTTKYNEKIHLLSTWGNKGPHEIIFIHPKLKFL